MAHNHEDIRSKRISGILLFVCFTEALRHLLSDVKHSTTTPHRCGAEAARGAHNSEVTRSKRVSGILLFAMLYRSSPSMLATLNKQQNTSCRCSSAEERLNTRRLALDSYGVRFTDGYPLITGRSLDRNQSSALFLFARFTEASILHHTHTHNFHRGGAEGARGAHNPEVIGSNPISGILLFACFIEARRHSYATLNIVFTGVAQWKRAVKLRPLPFNHLWFDLRMVMDHNPEVVGSKPTTGITLFFSS